MCYILSEMSPNTNRQKLIVVVGPTASGKSDLALRLAKLAQGKAFRKYGINGAEIISADSRQVYRGMDMGTGKVTQKEQKIVRHHLLDVVSPKKQFTAFDFKKLGEKALSDIVRRSRLPIIVGGTGFYIDVLLGQMQIAQVPPNKQLRAKLEKQSAEQLYSQLLSMDYRRTQKIDRYNKRRLVRALEIAMATKKIIPKNKAVLQYFHDRGSIVIQNNLYNILFIGIKLSRKKLEKRIKFRLDQRLKQGMVGEVKNLIKNGVSYNRLRKFGLEYKWLSLYLQNKISYEEMKENLYRDIVRYSKRQMTWFKKNKEIKWLEDGKSAEYLIRRFIS